MTSTTTKQTLLSAYRAARDANRAAQEVLTGLLNETHDNWTDPRVIAANAEAERCEIARNAASDAINDWEAENE